MAVMVGEMTAAVAMAAVAAARMRAVASAVEVTFAVPVLVAVMLAADATKIVVAALVGSGGRHSAVAMA